MIIETRKTFNYSDEDVKDILATCFEGGCSYWAQICNDTDEWERISKNCKIDNPNYIIEDVMLVLLENCEGFDLYDAEDDEYHKLTLSKFEHGITRAINDTYWNGDIDDIDGEIGDIIIQYALFNDIIFG